MPLGFVELVVLFYDIKQPDHEYQADKDGIGEHDPHGYLLIFR